MSVTTVVFDIGNVFVKWDPLTFFQEIFPDEDPTFLWHAIMPFWMNANLGTERMEEAFQEMNETTGLPIEGFTSFARRVMDKGTYLKDTEALQVRLKEAKIPLYYLSDNFNEALTYYRAARPFIHRFDGGLISAEVGLLKPDLRIYQAFLNRYHLDPANCVFFDDVPANVEGAQKAGMQAFVFTTAAACEQDIRSLGLSF